MADTNQSITTDKYGGRRWEITDHKCYFCGGRILTAKTRGQLVGANHTQYKCADCPEQQEQPFCWCVFYHRNQENLEGTYMCLPFSLVKTYPELRKLFLACGCDPDTKRAEVGIVLTKEYNDLMLQLSKK